MKKYVLFLFCTSLLIACQPDAATTTNQSVGVTSSGGEPAAAEKREVVNVPASVLAPMIGLWHYEAIAGVKDAEMRVNYEGRWIDLKGDQTFTSGIWQEQNNSGKWTLDPKTNLINMYYDKKENVFDEFNIQGIGGDIVVFKGNTARTNRGVQIKMVKYNDRPTQ